jgi:hypothetical protein
MLVVLSPGHIEELFKKTVAGAGRDDLAAIANKFGVLITGPALFENIYSVISPRARVSERIRQIEAMAKA